ncbi:MAG: penicillin-binding protein 1A [Lysobacterales bacterium CG02_land_8_20_14_3_00_62_12]|nr:MAG: penicillin-binding protein 1A [Xanthomonadales bacterium CG02_land_8_20_14_3_00_62_12]
MSRFRVRSWLRYSLSSLVAIGLIGLLGVGIAYWLLAPSLPDASQIREIRLQVPLRVFSADGKLMAMFGETKRIPVAVADIPKTLRQAVMAIEDARFEEHHGIDLRGIARAVWLLGTSDRDRVPGGSTITQQVARNFFLSNEYSVTRKASEIFLALKLERELSKDEILGLYLNKIFFGYRNYGVGAAAEFYYGKTLDQLTLAESAMLASIPKFPSTGNPLNNPERALTRRNYVLQRMAELGWITTAAMTRAQHDPDRAHPHEPMIELDAPFVAELARQEAISALGGEALNNGYRAITTIDSRLQEAANSAVHEQLLHFDQRHGYRGAEARIEVADLSKVDAVRQRLATANMIGGLTPAVVIEANALTATALLVDGQEIALDLAAVNWARPRIGNQVGARPNQVDRVVHPGDLIRLSRTSTGGWQLSQLPATQAAMVALDPDSGATRALVGGFNFSLSKFNRATMSNRQPGSSFKPFIYSAAFERGFTPASIINDAPISFPDPSSPGGVWTPNNDKKDFLGPMRLREALVRSRNLVSVRLLDAIGVRYAIEYLQRFGFTAESLPQNLSLALGTTSLSPMTLARGYATFANGGFGITPYLLERIADDHDKTLYQAAPARACQRCAERLNDDTQPTESAVGDLATLLDSAPVTVPPPTTEKAPAASPADTAKWVLAPRMIDERNAFLITSMLRDVVLRGTGHGAMVLERHDLSGKTGTTNDHRDAWFSGFNANLVATVWMGHDDFSSLGEGEFAARTALPIWIDFMRTALADVPETPLSVPAGITTARISDSGHLLDNADNTGLVEYFKSEDLLKLSASESERRADQKAEQQSLDLF